MTRSINVGWIVGGLRVVFKMDDFDGEFDTG